jgi:hypothetical protein
VTGKASRMRTCERVLVRGRGSGILWPADGLIIAAGRAERVGVAVRVGPWTPVATVTTRSERGPRAVGGTRNPSMDGLWAGTSGGKATVVIDTERVDLDAGPVAVGTPLEAVRTAPVGT